MLNLNSVMIGTTQPQELAAFYEKVLGKPADMNDPENGFLGLATRQWIFRDFESL